MTHTVQTGQMRAGHLELSATTPRDVRLTGAGTALIATAVALVVGAMASALVLFLAYTQSEERRELREREKRGINAQVVTVTRSGGDGRRRLVSYRFEVDGRRYTGRARLRDRDRRPVAQGARLSIEYLPSQPEESWIVGYEAKRFPLWTIPLVPISLLVLAVVAAARVRRQWTLLSEGRVAHARVTAHKRIHIGDHRGYRVNAEFRDLSGAMHMARYVSRTTPPPAGTVLPIVYHRDNPKWSAFYPLRLVRPTRGFEKVAEPPRPSRYLPAPKARRRSRGGERSH